MLQPTFTLRGVFCAAALLLVAGPAAAALVPLGTTNPDFADGALNNGDTATDGSILLTFGNVVTGDGGDAAYVDSDGIGVTGTGAYDQVAVSFTIIFDTDTMIDEYTVAYPDDSTTGFQLAGANGTSGLNALSTSGSFAFNMGTIPYFAAGQAYTLTAPGEEYGQIHSFNLSEAAPAPVPATALLLACGLVGLRGGRRTARLG